MSIPFSTFLKRFTLPGTSSYNLSTLGSDSLSDYLAKSSLYSVSRVEFLDSDTKEDIKEIELEFEGGIHALCGAFLYDSLKFSVAAFETINVINESLKDKTVSSYVSKNLPWKFVKYYYAGFYTVHSFLRSFGVGTIYLDTVHKRKFIQNTAFDSVDKEEDAKRITKGQYMVQYFPATKKLLLMAAPSGQSHERVWKTLDYFLEHFFINNLEKLKTSNPELKGNSLDSLLDKLESLRNIIAPSDCYYLSSMRNDLNYLIKNHSGFWYPHSGYSEANREKIMAKLDEWKLEPSVISIPSPGKGFIERAITSMNGISFLLSLNYQLVKQIEKDAGKRHNFHFHRSLKLVE